MRRHNDRRHCNPGVFSCRFWPPRRRPAIRSFGLRGVSPPIGDQVLQPGVLQGIDRSQRKSRTAWTVVGRIFNPKDSPNHVCLIIEPRLAAKGICGFENRCYPKAAAWRACSAPSSPTEVGSSGRPANTCSPARSAASSSLCRPGLISSISSQDVTSIGSRPCRRTYAPILHERTLEDEMADIRRRMAAITSSFPNDSSRRSHHDHPEIASPLPQAERAQSLFSVTIVGGIG